MPSNNINELGRVSPLDHDHVQSALAKIIRPLIRRSCPRYQYFFCELLPKPNTLDFCSDPQLFSGKVMFGKLSKQHIIS